MSTQAAASRGVPGHGTDRSFRFSPRTLGVALGLFALGYLVLAFRIPDYTAVAVPVQPDTLPRWLGAALLVLAVLLCFQHDDRADEAADDEDAGGTRLGRLRDPRAETAVFVTALVIYVAVFEPLGFVLSTAAYLGTMTWYLGYRRHLVTGLVAVAVPFGLYAVMTWGLDVALPRGPLPF